jgi:hypothetical protein
MSSALQSIPHTRRFNVAAGIARQQNYGDNHAHDYPHYLHHSPRNFNGRRRYSCAYPRSRGLRKLEHLMVSTPEDFNRELFEPNARVECIMAIENEGCGGLRALSFHNFFDLPDEKGCIWKICSSSRNVVAKATAKRCLFGLHRSPLRAIAVASEWSVDWNTPSIDFYKAMGATVMPEWNIVRAAGDAPHTSDAASMKP